MITVAGMATLVLLSGIGLVALIHYGIKWYKRWLDKYIEE